jgi:hypothetical protein
VLIEYVVMVMCQSSHGYEDLITDNAAVMMASKKNNHLDLGSVKSGSYTPLTRWPSQQSLTEGPPHV